MSDGALGHCMLYITWMTMELPSTGPTPMTMMLSMTGHDHVSLPQVAPAAPPGVPANDALRKPLYEPLACKHEQIPLNWIHNEDAQRKNGSNLLDELPPRKDKCQETRSWKEDHLLHRLCCQIQVIVQAACHVKLLALVKVHVAARIQHTGLWSSATLASTTLTCSRWSNIVRLHGINCTLSIYCFAVMFQILMSIGSGILGRDNADKILKDKASDEGLPVYVEFALGKATRSA